MQRIIINCWKRIIYKPCRGNVASSAVLGNIARHERNWVFSFALILLAITTIPYLIGFAVQGEDWRFTGFVMGVEDGNSYIAKMLSGSAGAWLFRTPYTAYPQKGFLAFLPYLLLGKLASPPGQHEQLTALFHVFRFVGGLLEVMAVYDLVSLFLRRIDLRRMATAVAVAGGGLGWLSVLGVRSLWQDGLPLEFYSPESLGFLAIYGLPHLAAARAFLLWGFCAYLSPCDDLPFSKLKGLKTGIWWLVLGLMQPLSIVVGWVVLLGHQVFLGTFFYWKRPRAVDSEWLAWKNYLWRGAWLIGLSFPLVFYNVIAFQVDPFLRAWEAQNIILSPPFLDYLLAYALVLPWVLLGFKRVVTENSWRGMFLAAWIALLPLMAYAPHNLQRRLAEGVWVALVVLAFKDIETRSERSQWLIKRFLYVSFLPAFVLILGGILAVQKPSQPLFRSMDEVLAFTFLAEEAQPGQVVLAAYETSNALPAWVPVTTLVGHGPESIHLQQVLPEVRSFYGPNMGDAERRQLISTHNVHYVVWGSYEESLGKWFPWEAPYLRLLYQNDSMAIYDVIGDGDKIQIEE